MIFSQEASENPSLSFSNINSNLGVAEVEGVDILLED